MLVSIVIYIPSDYERIKMYSWGNNKERIRKT